jgi:glycosyltransferase involved in cell wall biosynthesis
VFVFPSLFEGFGLGPLEAMASGTPVVACETSSIPEVTGDAAFLVAPGDTRAMAGAILSFLTQPEHAARQRNLGLARARDFSWRKTAEATLAVYERVARRG